MRRHCRLSMRHSCVGEQRSSVDIDRTDSQRFCHNSYRPWMLEHIRAAFIFLFDKSHPATFTVCKRRVQLQPAYQAHRTPFFGTLWMQYSSGGATGLVSRVGVVNTKVTEMGAGTSGGGSSPQYVASFDGTSSNINTGQNRFPTGNGPNSFFTWIYVPSTINPSNPAAIFVYGTPSNYNGMALAVYSDDALMATNFYNVPYGFMYLTQNAWHFVGYTYDGTTLTIYVDGSSESYTLQPQTVVPSIASIGSLAGSAYYDQGYISDAQFYNIALSSGQVSSLRAEGMSGTPVVPASIIGWWPLNGDATDHGSNGNGGTATAVSWVAPPASSPVSPTTYSFSVIVGSGGSVTCDNVACPGSYSAGIPILVTATPNSGYSFTGWTGGQCQSHSGSDQCSLTMPASSDTETAGFSPATTYSLSATAGTGGTVSCTSGGVSIPCTGSYAQGNMITITAIPNMDNAFSGWTGGTSHVQAPRIRAHSQCLQARIQRLQASALPSLPTRSRLQQELAARYHAARHHALEATSRNVNHNYCNAVREQCNQLVRNIMLWQYESVHILNACRLGYGDCNIQFLISSMQLNSHKQCSILFINHSNNHIHGVWWRRRRGRRLHCQRLRQHGE